jgi:2-polyprenyl-3-methyl-5-hydroxy-6-metoxy-1,4-benzoquinol methylase
MVLLTERPNLIPSRVSLFHQQSEGELDAGDSSNSDAKGPSDDLSVTADRWSKNVVDCAVFSARVYWLAIPEVRQRHLQRGVNGTAHPSWVSYCLGEFLPGRLPVERMLSIGCGSGALEQELAGAKAFLRCDAYDIAPVSIQLAQSAAQQAGLDHIRYEVRDANTMRLPAKH